jgi:type IV pilus assembly protein PilX
VIVLLLLITLSGLVLFSARNAGLSEGVARNELDAERARQAAESALRDAERDVMMQAQLPGTPCARAARPLYEVTAGYTANCQTGLCDTPAQVYEQSNWATGANADPWWPSRSAWTNQWNNVETSKPVIGTGSCTTFVGGVPLGTFTGAPRIAGVARQPEYLLEYIQRGNGRADFMRITARGFGALEQTQVVLQSYYDVPKNLQQ